MKTEITSLDLHYLLKELQILIDGKIDKIFQSGDVFLFQVFVSGKGKFILKVMPNLVYFTNFKEESEATQFCMFLRKHLAGARVREIKQPSFERIIEIKLETKEEKFVLIIELFSKGNIILCKEDLTIISAKNFQSWRSRTIRGGIKYSYPPEQVDFLNLDFDDFKKVLDKSEKEIVKTLAVDLSLGGLYAEELCFLSTIDKNKTKLEEKEIKQLYEQIKILRSKEINPVFYPEQNHASSFELEMFSSFEKKHFESLNKLLNEIITQLVFDKKNEVTLKKQEEKINKIKEMIKNQEEKIAQLESSLKDDQRSGELIYENYALIKEILEEINKAREKISWEEIKEKYKNHKIIKEILEKQGKLIIEV